MPFPARFPGLCARTGARINPGDSIASAGRGRYYLVARAAAPADADAPSDPSLEMARSIDPELADADPEAASHAGRYLRSSLARGVSDIWRTPYGKEFYRNRRGLCEDAPCCGCCNA